MADIKGDEITIVASERIDKAIEILKDSKLLFKSMPDFSLQDVENIIKKNIREN